SCRSRRAAPPRPMNRGSIGGPSLPDLLQHFRSRSGLQRGAFRVIHEVSSGEQSGCHVGVAATAPHRTPLRSVPSAPRRATRGGPPGAACALQGLVRGTMVPRPRSGGFLAGMLALGLAALAAAAAPATPTWADPGAPDSGDAGPRAPAAAPLE